MARMNGARLDAVELFALLHDSRRVHDGRDCSRIVHGHRQVSDALGAGASVGDPQPGCMIRDLGLRAAGPRVPIRRRNQNGQEESEVG